MKYLFRWVLLALALIVVAHVCPGVTVTSFTTALWAALVLGLHNVLLRPILVVLTLPATILTLGLFLFVINAVMFYFASRLISGFVVDGAVAALLGSLMYTVAGVVIDWVTERKKRDD